MINFNLTNLVLLFASISTILVIVIIFFKRRRNHETNYEKEMKKIRQLLLKGKIDRKTFLHIRDNLKVEDIFTDETQRLDNMLQQNSIDSETYRRMEKILKMNLNERLEKINSKYNNATQKITTKA